MIFVSYSHADEAWRKRFETISKPLSRAESMVFWSDKNIKMGEWETQIEAAMKGAVAAVLLVSDNFLASDYVVEKELPYLIKANKTRGLEIIWAYLEPCDLERFPQITKFQASSETIDECEDTDQDIPDYFELLIAVNIHKKQTYLFKLVGNRVLWLAPPRHECIGSGVHVIHPMLRDFQFVPTKETALFCGIRMMNRAKRIMPGVGGKTEAIALLNTGTTAYFGTANTALIEALAANFEEFLDRVVYTAVSNVSKKFPEIDENCEQSIEDLPEALKKYRDRYKELLDKPVY